MNNLYQTIIDHIRRIPKRPIVNNLPHSQVRQDALYNPVPNPTIPFAPGRIYKCIYRNYKHDPRPLLFILSSNAFYTHAINIHYLGGFQSSLMRMIINMKQSGKVLTGMIIYQFMKIRMPGIPKMGYRKYFTKFLNGKLVSDGISQTPLPGKALFISEPFVNALNKAIRPRVINKVRMSQTESDRLKNEMDAASLKSDQIIIGRKFGQ
jgi:hypothetical protein